MGGCLDASPPDSSNEELDAPLMDARWPMIGGDPAHRSMRAGTDIPEQWNRTVSHPVTAIALGEAIVVAATNRGPVYAFDLHGQQLWTYEYPTNIAPLVADGKVIVAASETITALSLATGKVVWSYGPPTAEGEPTPLAAVPAVVGKHVVWGTRSARIHAVHLESGTLAWAQSTPVTGRPVNTYQAAVADGYSVFLGSSSEGLTEVNAKDGTIQWHSETRIGAIGPLAIAENRLIAIRQNHFYNVVAFDEETREIVWSAPLDHIQHPPVVLAGAVYLYSDNGRLYRFDAEDGTLAWNVKLGNWTTCMHEYCFPDAPAPADASGQIIVNAGDGLMYAIHPETGAVLGSLHLGHATRSTPIVHGSTIYAGVGNTVQAIPLDNLLAGEN